ncbi:MAG: hypothetical protein AB7E74_26445, partial [Pirellulales bacterium]
NELAHPHGWRGPSADQLWDERAPISFPERAVFLATVAEYRALVRSHWNFVPDAKLTHYQGTAVDRRAVRDALLAHDLLKIHPRRQRGCQRDSEANQTSTPAAQHAIGAGTIEGTQQPLPPSTVGGAADLRERVRSVVRYLF